MGGCCSCCRANNEKAFKSELDAPLLRDIMTSLPPNTQIVVVKVLSADRIEGVGFSNTADPYVEMRLSPPDGIAGEQVKTTSKRPQTITPQWDPPEKFQYIVSNIAKSKVVFSVFHFNGTSDPTPLGDGTLSLKNLTEEPQELKVNLINPNTGKAGGECLVHVHLRSVIDAGNEEEHNVFQYQTWGSLSGWSDSLSPGDPGLWSTANGTRFEKTFEHIEPDIPTDWIVKKPWATISTSSDVEGWQYSDSFYSTDWHLTEISGTNVRRRSWVRTIQLPHEKTENPMMRETKSRFAIGTLSSESGTSKKERLTNLFK